MNWRNGGSLKQITIGFIKTVTQKSSLQFIPVDIISL